MLLHGQLRLGSDFQPAEIGSKRFGMRSGEGALMRGWLVTFSVLQTVLLAIAVTQVYFWIEPFASELGGWIDAVAGLIGGR